MKFIYALIIILIAIVLFYPKVNYSVQKDNYLKNLKGKKIKPLNELSKSDFYIPQSTLESVSLRKNAFNNQENANTITIDPIMIEGDTTIIRDDPSVSDLLIQPRLIRKDNMFPNMIGNTEHKLFLNDLSSDKSFEDKNVSQLPDFYTSDFNDEVTNIGKFFDETNQYKGNTYEKYDIPTECYMDNNNSVVCATTRLQQLPKTNCESKTIYREFFT